MNVFFTLPTLVSLNPWEPAFMTEVRAHFGRHPSGRYRLTPIPAEADLIVLLESNRFRNRHDIATLLQEPVVRDFPDRTFTINYEDFPAGFLPGLYAGLPVQRYDPARHRSWCYFFPSNPHLYELGPSPVDERCDFLFSFRGAESNPVRRKLFALGLTPQMRGSLTRIDRWFNHDAQDKDNYVQEIRRSRFVLCPRGVAPASHRLFEVMALGRCPVIIADEWVPPVEVNWAECSIRVAERDLDTLPDLLLAREREAAELGRRARENWEQFFSPARKFEAALDALVRHRDGRPADYDERKFQCHWHSTAFWRSNGWTLRQRVARKIRSFGDRLRSRR